MTQTQLAAPQWSPIQRGAGTVGYVHNIGSVPDLGVDRIPSRGWGSVGASHLVFPHIAVSLVALNTGPRQRRGTDACVGGGGSIPVEFVFSFRVVASLVFIGELGALWVALPGECLHDPRPVIVG